MSRFTEHFDIDTNQLMYSQGLSSPSKASFLSMSSSESCQQTIDPIFIHSFSSYENSSSLPSSPTGSSYEEKGSGNKLKRFLTTISKKKRSMSSHSQ